MSVPYKSTSTLCPTTACFSVHAVTDPAVVPAVASVLAKRGLVPYRWVSALSGAKNDEMQIDVQVEGLDERQASLLAASFRRLVCVETVLVSLKERHDRLAA